jgi:hypothetical protein
MQNQKRYWLRGGITVLVIWLVLIIVAHLFSNSGFAPIFGLPVVLLSLPANAIDFNSGIFYKSTLYLFGEATFLGFLFLVTFYFFIGSIIGFLYGKIKKQKQ